MRCGVAAHRWIGCPVPAWITREPLPLLQLGCATHKHASRRWSNGRSTALQCKCGWEALSAPELCYSH